jgi:hypothetical protein
LRARITRRRRSRLRRMNDGLIPHDRHVLSCRARKLYLALAVVASGFGGGRAETFMPSLFRFLLVLGLIAGAAFVGMAALVAFVEPQPREMSQPVPPSVLNK